MKQLVESLQQKYGMFKVNYDCVHEAACLLDNDPEKLAWAKKWAQEYKNRDFATCRDIELPESDGTLLGDMLPLFVLLPSVPDMVAMYEKRGLIDIMDILQIDSCISAVEKRIGRVGMNRRYFDWLTNYLKCRIFQGGVFRVEVGTHKRPALVLRHCCTGRYEVMMTDGIFHRSGNMLGAAGCTDIDGSFEADFRETDDEYCGHLAKDGIVSPQRVTLRKSEWEVYIKPQDDMLSLHIPKGASLTRETIQSSVKAAREIAKKSFPEFDIKAVGCYSWLLCPKLGEILGQESHIGVFGASFVRWPVKTDGMDVFGFVFPQTHNGYATLPENTRLERSLKKLYMDGGYILNTAGIVIEE
ncbi:MAG: hypothetical protein IKZ15_05340 [Clostridia bacterium]|nr:hypothetical protein [Clostridia bacterium]